MAHSPIRVTDHVREFLLLFIVLQDFRYNSLHTFLTYISYEGHSRQLWPSSRPMMPSNKKCPMTAAESRDGNPCHSSANDGRDSYDVILIVSLGSSRHFIITPRRRIPSSAGSSPFSTSRSPGFHFRDSRLAAPSLQWSMGHRPVPADPG